MSSETEKRKSQPLLTISVCMCIIRANLGNTEPQITHWEAAVSYLCCPASRFLFSAFELLLWQLTEHLILNMLSK